MTPIDPPEEELGPDEQDADLLDEWTIRTKTCPSCRAAIYEDADRCDVCGDWIAHKGLSLPRFRWWYVMAIALLAMVVLAMMIQRGWL
jgi:hypothetical protein